MTLWFISGTEPLDLSKKLNFKSKPSKNNDKIDKNNNPKVFTFLLVLKVARVIL